MRIRLLGTGAADGIPAYCANDKVSQWARKHGGKDIRSRAAALIDGELKLDLGPDTLSQIQRDRIDPCDWIATLYTHSDDDHLSVGELQYFLYPFNENEHMPFAIYGNPEVCRRIWNRYPEWPLEVHEIARERPFRIADFTITPVEANHKSDEESHNFLIEKDGRRLIYATDTGIWPDHTFEFVAGWDAHALVIECTEGFSRTDYVGHLDIGECVGMVQKLRANGSLCEECKVVTTHHSHQGNVRHCDLVKALGRFAIEPGYDGMEFDV